MHRFEWGERRRVPAPARRVDRLLRENGFEIEELIELQAPETARRIPYYAYVSAEWARRWPAEEIWAARKR